MTPRSRGTFPPVTIGHIRFRGVTRLLVYCYSIWCNHSATINGEALSDEVEVRSLCLRMVYMRCGLIGADVRLDWS